MPFISSGKKGRDGKIFYTRIERTQLIDDDPKTTFGEVENWVRQDAGVVNGEDILGFLAYSYAVTRRARVAAKAKKAANGDGAKDKADVKASVPPEPAKKV